MASLTQLPAYFALFDESLNRTKYALSPYSSRRYMVLHAVRRAAGPTPVYLLSCPSIPMSDAFNDCRCEMRYSAEGVTTQTPLEIGVEIASRGNGTWKIWRTGYSIENRSTGGFIPVLDCSPHLELPWYYSYQIKEDTEAACRQRQMEQRQLRASLLRPVRPPRPPTPIPHEPFLLVAIQAPPSPPSPPILTSFGPPPQQHPPSPPRLPPAAAPPRFVIEAVKEKAIKEEQSCPITMTSFEASSPAVLTSCYHLFEAEAIRSWCASHSTCPVCKQEIQGLYDA
jgi:hypothetical protein